ncbi:MFS transporter [Quisquiliibacterium transsilvanicum]|uniref:Putative MFS family arabinose efflux permease n=1 Tax=Quisquiliibacterium transsilvanicum TaxID=1549638 RepID=A0A7W8HGU9_9BURK|nr:MFS transporter [Quisquiliibacterium transsilvanicum]MBB5271819.1 putative MFS family arabinose efflux permease [Quisquiliibacterium transsilvanicum]
MTSSPERMTARELRASTSLASIFALRMLGLFLILPVFAVHARGLPGGESAALVGLALGVYGLTQAILHLPFGLASDRYGRKPVIVAGLILFAVGSFVAAGADTVAEVIVGRAIQGAGAISAAVTAFIADSTRDSQRTKAMAMVGGSIGLTFALSMVLAPALYGAIGMDGLFNATGVLALLAILVVLFVVPPAPAVEHETPAGGATSLRQVAMDADLLRLNLGIMVLHTVQMAMFVVVPGWLVERAGLPLAQHWQLYLGVVLASFALMLPPLFWSERRGRLREVFLGAVALLLAVALMFALQPAGLWPLAGLLLLFFAGFNVLEASLPSLVSRLAPADAKGAALGIYNTTQALGLFVGGALGGLVQSRWGGGAVFAMCAVLLVVWLAAAFGQRRWPGRTRAAAPA